MPAKTPLYPEYSVSTLTVALKRTLEKTFPKIIVEGEVSGWKRYPSGHCYFTLKDSGAQISSVMFSAPYEASCRRHPELRDQLCDGAKVKVFAALNVYPPKGNYQLNVLSVTLAGVGDLMRQYLELKARLEAEGLFDPAKKHSLPFLPRRIAIVTSEAGAVIHDMCRVLTRRFPAVEVRLYPCLVQGAEAPRTICAGIEHFNQDASWPADLLIVARGGGSFEDLFCFNDESVVRTVAGSRIPTISAVGHETDFTLCDFAADKRAGTPSIAAEIAVPVRDDLLQAVAAFRDRLVTALRARGEFFAQRIDQLSDTLAGALVLARSNAERRLEREKLRLKPSLEMCLQRTLARLEKAEAKLTAYSPYGVLSRGYSLTTDANGNIVRDATLLHTGDRLQTKLANGTISSVVS